MFRRLLGHRSTRIDSESSARRLGPVKAFKFRSGDVMSLVMWAALPTMEGTLEAEGFLAVQCRKVSE